MMMMTPTDEGGANTLPIYIILIKVPSIYIHRMNLGWGVKVSISTDESFFVVATELSSTP